MTSLLQSLWVAALAGVLATAALIVLHRLRVQPTQRRVATILFWHAAAREEEPRTLGQRFARHRTFAFLLLTLLLLAFACSDVSWRRPLVAQRPLVVVVDSGYSMMADGGGRFETRQAEAIRRAVADLQAAEGRPIAVIDAGPTPQLLSQFGDPTIIARLAIERIRPNSGPSAPAAALRLGGSLMPPHGGEIRYYGDRALALDEFPEDVRERVMVQLVGQALPNSALLAAIFEPDLSGRPLGALHVRVGSWATADLDELRVRVSGLPGGEREARVSEVVNSGGAREGTAVFNDITADGRALTVNLLGAVGISADDYATLNLPLRGALSFHVATPVPDSLRAACSALGSIVPNPTQGSIEVLSDGLPTDMSIKSVGPTIELVYEGTHQVIAGARIEAAASKIAAGLNFEGAVTGVGSGIASHGGVELLRAGDKVLAAIESRGERSRLVLSGALFAEGETITRRPAFFLILERACQSLAGWSPVPLSLARDRQLVDPLLVSRSLVDTPVTSIVGSRASSDLRVNAPSVPKPIERAFSWNWWQPWELALAAAVVLLAVESWLSFSRRII
jgi:hypothetical protein